ncbi:MAG: hypothetical protein WBJ17_01185 [Natronincolaceae bacterium]
MWHGDALFATSQQIEDGIFGEAKRRHEKAEMWQTKRPRAASMPLYQLERTGLWR